MQNIFKKIAVATIVTGTVFSSLPISTVNAQELNLENPISVSAQSSVAATVNTRNAPVFSTPNSYALVGTPIGFLSLGESVQVIRTVGEWNQILVLRDGSGVASNAGLMGRDIWIRTSMLNFSPNVPTPR
ncbi:MAG: hypothetical protein FWF57_05980 [Defluviitaleaceae bacterium]|nr:hypothetical protein [Defluviitaleaceae bacterium]